MKKRLFAIITGLAVAAVLIVPSPAAALTAEELQTQIDNLLAQLSQLQDQLADLEGETGGGTIAGCAITSFDRNLSVGATGDDVKCLQIVLNSDSDTQLSAGVGSPGQETSYFGPKTKAAVIKFQEKYADEVLASWGLISGTGYVGSTTRDKLNLAAGEEEEEEEVQTNWQHVDADSFTISLPPGWEFNKLQGIDSYVGEFVGDGAKLSFDYGWYSNPLVDDNDPDHIVTYEIIDGYNAKIVVPKVTGRGTTGVYFADLGGEIQKTRLQISGRDLTASQQETALKIFRTIKI